MLAVCMRWIHITSIVTPAVTWASLFIAYFSPYPIGFYLTSLAFAAYVLATAARPATIAARIGLRRLAQC